jgi:hypothetical protein
LAWVEAARASAPVVSPYGEVARFGGYDATAEKPGKFVLPVGFAVDSNDPSTPDHNAVYVLDRTVSDTETGELGYRLQKLSSTGEQLGSVTLPLQKYPGIEHLTGAHPLISLTVDSVKRRVYAVVESIVSSNTENTVFMPVVHELVAWSTEPNVSKKLVAAPGYPVDPVTGGGLVAGSLALQSNKASKDLYAPEAITVDPNNNDVVIEAQRGVEEGTIGGPTVLQRVATEGSKSGQLDGSWVTSEIAPANEVGNGLFTAVDGSFGLDLFGSPSLFSVLADVKPDFKNPGASLIAPLDFGEADAGQALTLNPTLTINEREGPTGGEQGSTDLEVYAAGTPIVQLSSGLYAARYDRFVSGDGQKEGTPWVPEGAPSNAFWTPEIEEGSPVANEGIRLFDASGNIVTTIGGQPRGQPCNIDDKRVALAAGANGSLFVLTQLNEANENSDDEVIEFAEGGSGACPKPGGNPKVNGTPGPDVTVHEGVSAEFDASSIERKGETPFEIDWNFEGHNSGGTAGTNDGYDLGAKIEEATEFKWPSPLAKHTYKTAGTFEAGLRVIGDYGTSVFPIEVTVLGSKPAVAAFATPGSIVAGQYAVFDGSASTPTPGSSIGDYHWSFGDGTAARDTQSPRVSHRFAGPGTYTVTLKITDKAGNTAPAASHGVTVSPAPPGGEGGENGGGGGGVGGGGASAGSSGGPSAAASQVPAGQTKGTATVAKPPTRARRLAAALRACRRKHGRGQRASCERQARRRYGSPAKRKGKHGKR